MTDQPTLEERRQAYAAHLDSIDLDGPHNLGGSGIFDFLAPRWGASCRRCGALLLLMQPMEVTPEQAQELREREILGAGDQGIIDANIYRHHEWHRRADA